jgi:transaldolase
MKPMVQKGVSTEDICEELMIADVAAAADMLKDIYTKTNGGDGYASIEVSPFLARDTQGTLTAARRIWKKLNRPNIMIKVPATDEGIPAIRTILEEGINVNVTLIFSDAYYKKVAEAYIGALEARAAKNQEIRNIASVASFFVSRVDAIVEKSFEQAVKDGKAKAEDKDKFFGKVGVANSKVAYASFEELFHSPRFKKLADKGARVQRPLWASTGTKNPVFSPVMYVEELAGRDTVNTLPPATLKALLEKGTIGPKLHQELDAARNQIKGLAAMNVPFDKLMVDLQADGVKIFADSYQELLDSTETKRKKLG